MESGDRSKGYEQITNLAAAVGLTVPAGSRRALIVATAQAVRWRADGTDPTGTVGMPLAVSTLLELDFGELSRVKFIESAAGAVLNVHYFG